jgi:Domain of unknown function (DUF202)
LRRYDGARLCRACDQARGVSDLNDPRVLFAAERTLLAWTRTASGHMALVASLRPAEIPPRYWPNLAVFTSLAVAAPGYS